MAIFNYKYAISHSELAFAIIHANESILQVDTILLLLIYLTHNQRGGRKILPFDNPNLGISFLFCKLSHCMYSVCYRNPLIKLRITSSP